jgi:hypothetical protein
VSSYERSYPTILFYLDIHVLDQTPLYQYHIAT